MNILKIFFLIFVIGANANIFERISNITIDVQKKIDFLKRTKDTVQFVIKTTFDTGSTAAKDIVKEVFDSSKIPPRIPVPGLIKEAGYPVESHFVTTLDGYILNIHRIPHGKTEKRKNAVVYLQHGIMCASSDWVLFGEKHGLAYILADQGYDVWMGNTRGNFYSRNHTTWNPDKDAEYWQFSWNEMGIYDLPAMIDYALNNTGKQNLYYIGHSQGNTAFYVMASEKPEYNKKVKLHISLAPVAYLKNTVSPLLQLLSHVHSPLGYLMELAGKNEFLPENGLTSKLTNTICRENIGKVLCKNILFIMVGFNPKQLDVSNLGLILAHYPAGAATKQIIHYQQETISDRFCKYDFGEIKNYQLYNQSHPLPYDLSKISAPVVLIYSHNDWLTHKLDVNRLSRELGNIKEIYLVPDSNWNHLDFIFANDSPKIIYKKVVDLLENS
ncbi:unnamed protein product [Diabrotica balteata]|uniref:Partial AB-hydrolase lipase domain-containing protein n=1 Tax=Diabrotica balteata TaxID=107213 RepID=A0A9N9T5L7_DIABA|nr:unnamed protein product [Diabrotica balteata]